jgi:hypothetical protein
MTLKLIQCDFHMLLLQIRNLHRIIHSFEFESAYARANEEQKKAVKINIDEHDQLAIEKWITLVNSSSVDISILSVSELRKLGRKKGIDGYQYLPKASLLSALKQVESKNELSVV